MRTKLIDFANKPFVRNVAVVATGTAGAQVVAIAFAPIITRIYGPDAFGLLGTFMALVAVLVPIAALTYPIAIVLPKEDSEARGIARLSVYISLVVAILVTLGLLAGGDRLLHLVGAHDISAFVMLIPLNMLFASWLQIAEQWLIRKKQFKVTAKVAVAKAIVVNSATSAIGIFHPFASVLIIFSTIGSALHAVMLYVGAKKADSSTDIQSAHDHKPAPSLRSLAKCYYDFPVYRAPQVFINTISQSLPVLMLAGFFGPASAGFYVLGIKLLGIPTQLIGKSVGDVFYPKITEASYKGENLSRLILKATLILATIGFPPFAIVAAFGPWIFGFVFGADWIISGEYARWLSPWLFFQFINRPSVAAVPVLGFQKGLMLYELFSTGTKILALYIGFVFFVDDTVAVALFSMFGTLAYIVLIAWVIISSKRRVYDK